MDYKQIFKQIQAQLDQIFNKQKNNIVSALALIAVTDMAFAAMYLPQFLHNRQCRNYMVFGSALHSCSTLEFIKHGWNFLAFSNLFLFLPVILLAMLMPHLIATVKQFIQHEE